MIGEALLKIIESLQDDEELMEIGQIQEKTIKLRYIPSVCEKCFHESYNIKKTYIPYSYSKQIKGLKETSLFNRSYIIKYTCEKCGEIIK